MRQHRTIIFGPKLLPQPRRRAPAFSHVKPSAHSDDHNYSDRQSNDSRIHQIEVHRNLLETNYLFTTFANRAKPCGVVSIGLSTAEYWSQLTALRTLRGRPEKP